MKSIRILCLILAFILIFVGCEGKLTKSPKQGHDIAITGISVLSRGVRDYTVPVVVNIENQGDCGESFDVKLTDVTDATMIGTKSVRLSPAGAGGMDEICDLTFTGENEGDYFGDYLRTGDVNGDGYDDLLVIGASRYCGNTGRLYLYYGREGKMVEDADKIFTGENAGDYFAEGGALGDVNGDGYDDVLSGAPLFGPNEEGRVYLYYGGSGMKNNADLILDGEPGDRGWFGRWIAVGDVNNDGYEDVFITATKHNNSTGRVYLYYGGTNINANPDKIFNGEAVDDRFGLKVFAGKDVNGDTYGDVIVGSRNYGNSRGRAYLFYGALGKTMDTTCDKIFTGYAASDQFGSGVCLSDIDNDNYADVLVTARQYGKHQGRAYLYWGAVNMDLIPDKVFNGEPMSSFGGDDIYAGLVNNDNYPDIIVPAYNYVNQSRKSRVYLYYGGPKDSMDTICDCVFTPDGIGNIVMDAKIADFNGDNLGDITFGGWGYPNSTKQGRVWLYYNQPASSVDLNFNWDTTKVYKGKHILRATIAPVTGEKDIADNTVTKTINLKERP